jgi:cytochrome c556
MRYFCGLAGGMLLMGSMACAHGNSGSTTTTAPQPAPPPSGTGMSAPAQAVLTPQNLEELMKKIGPTYKSLTERLRANETAEAGKEAQQLAEWFGGVEKFWTQHRRADAVKFAESARTFASDAAGAAAAGNGDKATAAANNLGGACKQCHGTYRESDGQGGYRIRPGVIAPM